MRNLHFVVVAYHATIVASGQGLLKKFRPRVKAAFYALHVNKFYKFRIHNTKDSDFYIHVTAKVLQYVPEILSILYSESLYKMDRSSWTHSIWQIYLFPNIYMPRIKNIKKISIKKVALKII